MNRQCSLPPWQLGKIVSLSSLPSINQSEDAIRFSVRRLCGFGAEDKTILGAVTRLPLYHFTFLLLNFFIAELFYRHTFLSLYFLRRTINENRQKTRCTSVR